LCASLPQKSRGTGNSAVGPGPDIHLPRDHIIHGLKTGIIGALGRSLVSGDELIGDVVEVVADNLRLRTDAKHIVADAFD
jgi:hypothetical protein